MGGEDRQAETETEQENKRERGENKRERWGENDRASERERERERTSEREREKPKLSVSELDVFVIAQCTYERMHFKRIASCDPLMNQRRANMNTQRWGGIGVIVPKMVVVCVSACAALFRPAKGRVCPVCLCHLVRLHFASDHIALTTARERNESVCVCERECVSEKRSRERERVRTCVCLSVL